MQSALDMFLRRFITVGRLTVRWPDGRTQIYAGRPGPEASVMLCDRRTVWRLILNPKLSVGEAYMDGGLVSLGGSIHDVLAVVLANLRTNPKGPLASACGCPSLAPDRSVQRQSACSPERRSPL
jgi:cyclopropane-fatty-acyl-phospholipid synthase